MVFHFLFGQVVNKKHFKNYVAFYNHITFRIAQKELKTCTDIIDKFEKTNLVQKISFFIDLVV